MKTLNDNTIKQLGNGILSKVKNGCPNILKFKVDHSISPNLIQDDYTLENIIDYKAGDIITINNVGLITDYTYIDLNRTIISDIPYIEKEAPYSTFIILKVESIKRMLVITAIDKHGNIIQFINSGSGFGIIILVKTTLPVTYNIDCTNLENESDIINSILNSKAHIYKKGDKINISAIGDQPSTSLFEKGIYEITDNEVDTSKTGNSNVNYLSLTKKYSDTESVTHKIGYYYDGTIFTWANLGGYDSWTTNCSVNIESTYNNGDYNFTGTIRLPISNKVFTIPILTVYIPKIGDRIITGDLNNDFIILSPINANGSVVVASIHNNVILATINNVSLIIPVPK